MQKLVENLPRAIDLVDKYLNDRGYELLYYEGIMPVNTKKGRMIHFTFMFKRKIDPFTNSNFKKVEFDYTFLRIKHGGVDSWGKKIPDTVIPL